jgi:hypothetical protein
MSRMILSRTKYYCGDKLAYVAVKSQIDPVELGVTNPINRDMATLAQRKANSPLIVPKPQKPCDVGLFSDEKDQLDLADMPMFTDAIEEE